MEKLKEFYSNLSALGRGLFFGAIISFFLMLMDLLVLGPILAHLRDLDGEIRTTHQAIERNLRIISFKDNILKEYDRYRQYLDAGDRSQEEIISSLLRKIENLATQNNIKINNVMPGELEEKPIYQVYSTSLEFEGALADVITFINQLTESDNLFQITKYSLVPKSKSGEELKAVIEMERVLIEAEDLEDVVREEDAGEDEDGFDVSDGEEEFEDVDQPDPGSKQGDGDFI